MQHKSVRPGGGFPVPGIFMMKESNK
jgi:hypothetical protein